MKKVIRLIVFIFGLLWGGSIFGQIGIGTNQAQKSSALEIKSNQRGLLIPRIELIKSDDKSPIVDNPANSLLIYNTAARNDVTPGFYYWYHKDGAGDYDGYWISIRTDKNQKNPENPFNETFIKAGSNLEVDSTQNEGSTTYAITLQSGRHAGQVLMTQIHDGDTISTWTELENLIHAENGLYTEMADDSLVVKLGGQLKQETTIKTNGYAFLFKGLNATANPDSVVVKTGDTLHTVRADYFFKNTKVKNGLKTNGDTIVLGGALTHPTIIRTSMTDTLSIKGLKPAEGQNKIMVSKEGSGTLRTVTRSLYAEVNTSYAIASELTDYSPYVQEITINVPLIGLNTHDIDLTLPQADGAMGQIINVKLSGGNEADHYLNIKDQGDNKLTYGALPYQSWVLKSNGKNWILIASN